MDKLSESEIEQAIAKTPEWSAVNGEITRGSPTVRQEKKRSDGDPIARVALSQPNTQITVIMTVTLLHTTHVQSVPSPVPLVTLGL